MRYEIKGLPQEIRIAGYTIKIQVRDGEWSTGSGHYAEFCGAEQEIRVINTAPSSQRAADHIIHELLHGIWWAYNIEDADKEERTVGTLATGLVQVWRDNPDLMDWIDRATKT